MVYESPWEHTGDGAVHATVEDLVKWGEKFNYRYRWRKRTC